ncbi:MAG: hypothetical protein WKG01_33060 [Kofleriaceae bacterium]
MRVCILYVALFACACPSKPTTTGTGNGTGHTATGTLPAACEGIRGKLQQLYRAEAQAKEPARVEQAVADNTAMVLADCAAQPDKVAACVRDASTVQDVEARCVTPLDDEGTEGEAMRR